jgi:hypothetical protein
MDALVRSDHFVRWRELDEIREVRALIRELERRGRGWSMPVGWLPPTPEQQAWQASERALGITRGQLEPLLVGLYLASRQTGADVGLLHVFSRSRGRMVTVFSLGEGLDEQENRLMSEDDPAFRAALEGRGVMGSHGLGTAQRAVAERLNHGAVRIQGLAMLPLRVEGALVAMVELGRWDHPFRAADKRRLAVVAGAIEQHFGR